MNLAGILAKRWMARSHKTAVRFESDSYTYGQLDGEICLRAAMLNRLGIKKGDRVAIQLDKCMEFLFLHFAVLSLGAVTLPLNSDYKPEELEYFLTDSESALFITDSAKYRAAGGLLGGIAGLRILLTDSGPEEGVITLQNELAKGAGDFVRPYPTEAGDTAMICYTSGTTGRSKGAMITHMNLLSNIDALHGIWGWSDSDVLLHVLPLFHVHGLNVASLGSLYAGATMIMHEKFEPGRAWKSLVEEGCTVFMAVPTIYQRLMNEWDAADPKPDLSGMRLFVSGSAPLSGNLFERFEKATGMRILERYGMTETGMNTSNTLDPAGRVAKSVGYPLPGTTIMIAADNGGPVVPGEVGEVWIKGPNVFKGYWNMPEKTAESFADGWFKSGDLGYADPADGGRIYLVGRGKELIITGGYNVYPKEIESIIENHPSVKEVAVIGIPDEDFGEKVVAVVALNDGAPAPPAGELAAMCKAKLAGYKCPKQIHFVDALPRNAMGKIQKNVLTKTYGPEPEN